MERKNTRFKVFNSFKYAFEGLHNAVKTETNWRIGLIEAVLVLFISAYFNITKFEWMIVMILIGIVLMAELFNSAIETIVNSFTQDHHPSAKAAKDFAAAAVVVMVIISAFVGTMIFLPYILAMFKIY